MSDKTTKGAMGAVLEDMGRAAREGRARRFNKKRASPASDREVDPVKTGISEAEETELMNSLTVER